MSQQINLFNPIFLKQKKTFSAVNMLDALAVLLVGVALFYGYASIETLNLDRQSVETARQYHQSQARLAEASARYARKKLDTGLETEVNRLQAQLNARKAALDELGTGMLASGASYAEYLRALARQSLAGVWLTRFSVGTGGADMEIVGRALQPGLVPSYIQRLVQEPAMHGRSFDSLNMAQRVAALPADASRPAGATASYNYIEFRLGSSYAELPADGEGEAAAARQAVPAPPGIVSQAPDRATQNGGGSR
ncbi:MAG: MSHA biogenesis protein MshI [Burkholderiales bacterium]|nr:MSHA biogenesis protein MshI [Burkholderiales bacterium]